MLSRSRSLTLVTLLILGLPATLPAEVMDLHAMSMMMRLQRLTEIVAPDSLEHPRTVEAPPEDSKGATLYYRNGNLASHYAGDEGATWYYPNGQLATHYAGRSGATWYYPNGKLATHQAGEAGATWYYPNGKLASHYLGQSGATYYYSNGKLLSHYGPGLPETDLLNAPKTMLWLLWINGSGVTPF